MNPIATLTRHETRRTLLYAVYAAGFAAVLPLLAHADQITPPPVPATLQVPAGNSVFLEGHAVGTQDYICLPCPNALAPSCTSGFVWAFFAPQATLFDVVGGDDKQIITHFLSPDLSPISSAVPPETAGTPRPTWQHSKDTSTVWAKKIANSSDAAFVAPGAIDWFLLQAVGSQTGPTGGDRLTATTYIQRLNTSGGVAPSTTCDQSAVGKMALVPYSADYFFYRPDHGVTRR